MKLRKKKVEVWIYALPTEGGEPRFLVLKMLSGRGGFWQPVTGGVEAGESLPAAALREAVEETGIAFESPVESLEHSFEFESRGVTLEEHGFALRAPSDSGRIRLDPHEHEDFRWVSAPEALQLLQFQENGDMLRILLKRLGH